MILVENWDWHKALLLNVFGTFTDKLTLKATLIVIAIITNFLLDVRH